MRFWQASLRGLEMEAADVGDVGGVTHFALGVVICAVGANVGKGGKPRSS